MSGQSMGGVTVPKSVGLFEQPSDADWCMLSDAHTPIDVLKNIHYTCIIQIIAFTSF